MRAIALSVALLCPAIAAARTPIRLDVPVDPTGAMDDRQLGLIRPAPPTKPLGTIVYGDHPDARPYPEGMLLSHAPTPCRRVATFGKFDPEVFGLNDATVETLPSPPPWAAFVAFGLAAVVVRRRRLIAPIAVFA